MGRLHPGVNLAGWLTALLAVQFLEGRILALAMLMPVLLGRSVLSRGVRLCWRTRWLLATLFLVFSFGTPGESLWSMPLSPSWEGLQEAGKHLGRLVLVLCVVAALLETMSLESILSGLHCLLAPLRKLGCDSERFVIRMLLVLRYVEQWPRPRDWRLLLDTPQDVPMPRKLVLRSTALKKIDFLFIFLLLVFVMVFCGWQVAS